MAKRPTSRKRMAKASPLRPKARVVSKVDSELLTAQLRTLKELRAVKRSFDRVARDVLEMNAAVEGLVRAHRAQSAKVNELERFANHLADRVTALDGQVGGGDEATSLAEAEAAAAASRSGGES